MQKMQMKRKKNLAHCLSIVLRTYLLCKIRRIFGFSALSQQFNEVESRPEEESALPDILGVVLERLRP